MTFRDDLLKYKLQIIMNEEKNYEFPEFIKLIRQILGFSRKYVAEMMDVSTGKILYLEKGKFVRGPDLEFIISLSSFYGLNRQFIKEKYNYYINKQKNEEKI